MLNEARLNCIGICDNCILIQLSPEKLEEYKQNQMQKITGKSINP